jgi:adenylate kinase family enzyme
MMDRPMQRLMIVGAPGSGKSTLARQLGQATGLPVFHMDHIHWLPDWVERPVAEKRALAAGIEARPDWILEGGLASTYDNRAARADTLVWLDLPIGLRLWRVVARSWRYRGRNRPDLPVGCVERFDRGTRDFLWYILRTRRKNRARIAQLLRSAARPGLRSVHLRTRGQVTDWVDRQEAGT